MNSNDPSPQKETVSQSEVESLLSQVGGGDSSREKQPPADLKGSPDSEAIQSFAFRRLSSFSPTQLRKLRIRHEEFLRSLAARLSIHLRSEIALKMSRLETMPFHKFVDELASPTYLALLELDPLKGICLLEIPSQLGLSIIDRELGGAGTCGEEERALTEIEGRILGKFVEMTISEWCNSWRDMLELKPALVGNESNGGFLQGYTPETTMLVLGVELEMGELSRQMHFAFPYDTLEPLIRKLNSEATGGKKPAAKIPSPALKWNPLLDEVPIKISAQLPALEITAKELAKLTSGQVILLQPEMFRQVQLSLAQRPKFVATMGRCGSRWAAKISKAEA
jgi:flagellar motor switch protein FliM